MDARNFRFLFENTTDGIIHSGCILDTIESKQTNFVYMCGVRSKKEARANQDSQDSIMGVEKSNETCHILVMASFTMGYIRKMLRIIKKRRIETVIIPYVAPIQRLVFSQRYMDEFKVDLELQAFMEQPYVYLKNAGIENIYFLYGNGTNLTGDMDHLEEGHHFEPVDTRECQTIQDVEGCRIPVVKAGYIQENKWIFYFGHYGRDININEQFPLKFFGRKKNQITNRVTGPTNLGLLQAVHEYTKQYGELITSTIVMYQGPLFTDHREIDSVMAGKLFTKEQKCVPEISEDGRNCFWKCLHDEDHTIFKRHKNPKRKAACFGTLLLGNADISKCLPVISKRYGCVVDQIRAITLPGCGKREYWNRQCLTLMFGEDIKYWICGLGWETSPAVISDIVVANPRNHVVTISEEFGYCFSGYLVPPVENE